MTRAMKWFYYVYIQTFHWEALLMAVDQGINSTFAYAGF